MLVVKNIKYKLKGKGALRKRDILNSLTKIADALERTLEVCGVTKEEAAKFHAYSTLRQGNLDAMNDYS